MRKFDSNMLTDSEKRLKFVLVNQMPMQTHQIPVITSLQPTSRCSLFSKKKKKPTATFCKRTPTIT